MKRPIALMSVKWADEAFSLICQKAHSWGYDGLEIAPLGDHFDYLKAKNQDYVDSRLEILEQNSLKCFALGVHKFGHCFCSQYDERYETFLPQTIKTQEAMQEWACEQLYAAADAAIKMGTKTLVGFLGSPIWKYWYSYPPTSTSLIDAGFDKVASMWKPLLDYFHSLEIKLAVEVHPTDIVFDFYTAQKLLKHFDNHPALGFNLDPSHFVWQGMNPALFAREFYDKIFHVHMKDVSVNPDGKSGILGSFLEFGDTRRLWNPRTLGRGNVNFEEFIRELNSINYSGPLSVEWEDNGMERDSSALECIKFVQHYNYASSDFAFDTYMKKN